MANLVSGICVTKIVFIGTGTCLTVRMGGDAATPCTERVKHGAIGQEGGEHTLSVCCFRKKNCVLFLFIYLCLTNPYVLCSTN